MPSRRAFRSTRSAPTPEGGRAGLDEVGRGLQVDAARGDEVDLGQGRLQGLDVAGAAQGAAGEDLDHVGARLPGRHHLGRGERARHDRARRSAGSRRWWPAFSAGLTTNCAPARMQARAVSGSSTVPAPTTASAPKRRPRSSIRRDRARHGHGDLEDGDAAGADGVDGPDRLVRGLGAHHGHDADLADAARGRSRVAHRCTRAVPPFITRSTSARRGHGGVAGRRHGQRAVGGAALDGPLRVPCRPGSRR